MVGVQNPKSVISSLNWLKSQPDPESHQPN